MFQKSWVGAAKDCKSCGIPKNTCLEHSAGKQVFWKQLITSLLGMKGASLKGSVDVDTVRHITA